MGTILRSAGFHAAIAFAVLLSGFTVGLTGSGEGTFRLGMTICAAASAGLNATEGGVAGNVDSVPAAGMSTGLPVAESGTNNEMTSSGGMSGAGRENSGVDGLNEVRKLKQLEVERIDGGRILKVELSKSKFEAAKLVLADLQGQFSGLDVVLLEGNDGKYMVLSGQSPEDVESLKDTLFFMLGIDENMPRFLVDISAVLKQYSNDEAENVGFPLVPSVVSATGAAAAVIPVGPNAQYGQTGPYMYSFQPATRWQVVTLYNNSALGKVMVGSNVLAQEGETCTIVSTDTNAYLIQQAGGGQGQSTTTTQSIVTQINVLPTIVRYDAENISNSLVRINVDMQMSVPTSLTESGMWKFTEKKLQTSRLLRADGLPIIAGSFLSDEVTPSSLYFPILGQIPILKYFFSYDTTKTMHQVAVLFLTARLVPEYR